MLPDMPKKAQFSKELWTFWVEDCTDNTKVRRERGSGRHTAALCSSRAQLQSVDCAGDEHRVRPCPRNRFAFSELETNGLSLHVPAND